MGPGRHAKLECGVWLENHGVFVETAESSYILD